MLIQLAKNNALVRRLRAAWRHDALEVTKPMRSDLRRLQREVERLTALLAEVSERAARGDQVALQVRDTLQLNEAQGARLASVPRILDEARITAHVREAVSAATIHTDPYEHVIVERVLPDDVYNLLIDALPPPAFFGQRDPIKQDLPLPLDFGPVLSARVWNFANDVLAQRVLTAIVLEKFHEPLQQHFDVIFGPGFRERANALPRSTSGGRLMLRRPGYHLAPHRDPKRSFVTCLLYLARPGDSETYGTQLFRVIDDREAGYKQTYYPEQDGKRCELVKVVPFRANSMLAFMNSRGAHGATIPPDAPADVERYAYQFYVAPDSEKLSALIRELPKERRAMWRNKNRVQ